MINGRVCTAWIAVLEIIVSLWHDVLTPTWLALPMKTSQLTLSLLFSWVGDWQNSAMSMRYKPVALVLKSIVFCRRVRVHLSWLVSKMPPNCLKARLENKNGVLPLTTSTPSQTFSPDEWLKGNKTLYMLVNVWLFPKRNLIWLGRCCTWDLTWLGRRCKRQLRVWDPMMHRLAPVSSMAWAHCSSLACRTGISGINSQAVSLVLASRELMGLVLVTACLNGLHSVETEGKNCWAGLDGLRWPTDALHNPGHVLT